MRLTNHNGLRGLTDYRIPRVEQEHIPFGMLKSYLNICKESFPQNTLECLYAKCNKNDPSVVTDLKSAFGLYSNSLDGSVSVEQFRSFYQATSFLKKYPFKGNADTCRSEAISRFYLAERMCRRTNRRLSHYRLYPFRLDSEIRAVRARARKIISRVLGNLDIADLVKRSRPGPGLSHGLDKRKASETTKFFKYTDNISATSEARFLSKGMISMDPHWLTTMYLRQESHVRADVGRLQNDVIVLDWAVDEVEGNRITFVPKDSSTDRTIAIEPSGNIMLQLGVGDYIKERLTPWGINLRDQGKNQLFAQRGSIPGDDDGFVTIDMSMASDTVSIETVRDLLPADWFTYLDKLRSKKGSLLHSKGLKEDIIYDKFSSMGNGFTFELESLIFFALTCAARQLSGKNDRPHNDIAVFGDDVVCRTSVVPTLLRSLSHWGFSINDDKSFLDGPFRESCGRDYLLGIDVRPFFLRRKVATVRDIHFVANSIMYKSMQQETSIHWDAYEFIFHKLPKRYLIYGPLHFDLYQRAIPNGQVEQSVVDDLEANLRVPMSWALENGLYVWRGNKYQNISYPTITTTPQIFTRKYSGAPYTQVGRYHTFLQGVRRGDIVLRGAVKHSLRSSTTSRWDGCTSHQALRYAPLA